MKRFLCFCVLIMTALTAFCQEVKVIRFDEMEKRFSGNPDTVYIVNFWATWCVPCVKEIPFFEQLSEKYKSEPVKIIFYSLDFKSKLSKEVIPFIKKNNIKSEVLLNQDNDEKFINAVSENWSGAIPATLVINNRKGIRNFYEQEFDFDQLEEIYLKSK